MGEKDAEDADAADAARAVDSPRCSPPALPPPPLPPVCRPPPGLPPPPGLQLPPRIPLPPGVSAPPGLLQPPGLRTPPGLQTPPASPPSGTPPPLSTGFFPEPPTPPPADMVIESNMLEGGRFGFMRSLADENAGTCVTGNFLGRGSSAVVYELLMVDADQQAAVNDYTGGAGLVVKILAQEPDVNPNPHGRLAKLEKNIPPMVKQLVMIMSMRRELEIVLRIPSPCHPNVMSFFSINVENPSIVMAAAKCDMQSLLVEKRDLLSRTRAERMRLLAGGALGAHHVHSELGMTHGDLKPENILVTDDFTVKISDFGMAGYSGEENVAGSTKRYAAPEAIAALRLPPEAITAFGLPEGGLKRLMHPALDAYAFGLMVLQMLFVEEHPRTSREMLKVYQPVPRSKSYDVAINNIHVLETVFIETSLPEDYVRLKEAEEVLNELNDDHGAQIARMSDLRETLLARGLYPEIGGLRFREEVELILLSLLNKDPTRRMDLGALAKLLNCAVLWSEAASPADVALPDDVLSILDDVLNLIAAPERNTEEAEWWRVPCFDAPWWENPPPVEPVNMADILV